MKCLVFFLILGTSSSCTTLPQLYKTAEDVLDNKAVEIMISTDVFQKQTNLNISIDVKNVTEMK